MMKMNKFKLKAWHKADEKIYDVYGYSSNQWFLKGKGFPMPLGAIEILRYTGQTDAEGTEIYEGFILTSEEYPFQDEGKYNYHGIVEWSDEHSAFFLTKRIVNKEKRGISDGISEPLMNYDLSEFQIIGNIYANPDLDIA
jgi:hypothetical protein